MKKNQASGTTYGIYLFFLIIVVTLIIYSPVFQAVALNWDDSYQVFANPDVIHFSLATLPNIFTTYVVGMYQPLTTMVFGIEYSLWGPNALGYHWVSVIIHLLNITILFRLLSKNTRNQWLIMLPVALFAFHPVNVEAITWISSLSTPLFSLFYLLAIDQYLMFRKDSKKRIHYILLILFFLLSLFAKPAAITLPIALMILDVLLESKIKWPRILDKIPLLILSIIFGVVVIHSRSSWLSLTTDLETHYSFWETLSLSSAAVFLYFKNLILPIGLNPYVSYPLQFTSLSLIWKLAPVALLLVLAALLFVRKKIPYLTAAIVFVGLQIALVLPMFFISRQFIADRYLYLSSFVLFAGILAEITSLQQHKKGKYLNIILLVICVAFALQTTRQASIRQHSIKLWTAVIEKGDAESQVYLLRADAYLEKGMAKEAMNDYNQAIAIDPTNFMCYINRAFLLEKTNNIDRAISDYGQALKLNPEFSKGWDVRGALLLNKGLYDQAQKHFEKAIDTDSMFAEAYYHKGLTYSLTGNFVSATKDFEKAISLDANQPQYYFDLGNASFFQNEYSQAIMHYSKAIELSPANPDYYYSRGYTKFKTDDISGGCEDMQKADKLGNKKAAGLMEQWCQQDD